MKEKICLALRVYNISDKYNVEKSLVRTIISEYLELMKLRLLTGERIDFLNLLYIEPDIKLKKYNTTLGYTCKLIADKVGLPQHTVYIIVKEYLLSLKDSILEGRTAELRGIVTIHPIRTDNKLSGVHSAISISIRRYIEEHDDCVINAVRVHTYKSLKDAILNEAV